jgi:hypothetical protein
MGGYTNTSGHLGTEMAASKYRFSMMGYGTFDSSAVMRCSWLSSVLFVLE